MLIFDLNSLSSKDVLARMRELNIQCTSKNFAAIQASLENLASAWASVALQDATEETMVEWIEIFGGENDQS